MRLDGPRSKPPKGTVWSFAVCCGPGGNHECTGCACGCHKLDPWPWETGDGQREVESAPVASSG